jgi:branched-chain amino acid transport system permease protein
MKLFLLTFLNGMTLAALYFLVASGFTLVFGLMRNVNLAHGSLYLLGAYIGYTAGDLTDSWFVAIFAGTLATMLVGLLMQVLIFRRMEGEELRQTLVTIGVSIILADAMLAIWGGGTYQFDPPEWLYGAVKLPLVQGYPKYRLVVLLVSMVIGVGLWLFLTRTRVGMMIRAGVDDRAMLLASGINVQRVFATTFAIGGGLVGFAGVVGGTALSIAPGEDTRYLLASLIVVIVGGMGSVPGAAVGAILIGLAEQFGLAYSPTYGVVYTFVIMVAVLAFRPQGILGRRLGDGGPVPSSAVVATATPDRLLLRRILPPVSGLLLLLLYPLLVPPFWAFQIGGQALLLGVISLSLMFLGGYGGMLSLAQMTVAGIAGYMLAVIGGNSLKFGLMWPWWAAVPAALAIATLAAVLIGAISLRTQGIYTVMITIAIAVAFFYLVQQNYALFNGHSGFAGVLPPSLFGIDWRAPVPFYYLCLVVAGMCFALVLYLSRSNFGIALQAARDNPRRMRALGFNVTLHRVVAYAVAGFIAALGGVLLVWFNSRISPGTVDTGPVFAILVIAVLGGMRHPIGPFLGAVIFVLLQNFAIDLIDRERFNTLIGVCFVAIVLFSPDGLLGLWEILVAAVRRAITWRPGVLRPVTPQHRFQSAAQGRLTQGRKR